MEIEEQIQDSIDEMDQTQQIVMDQYQLPLVTTTPLTNQIMTGANSTSLANGLITSQFPYQISPSYQIPPHINFPHPPIQPDKPLQILWAKQFQEIKAPNDFKNHSLPLARIKKIMKADEDVKMIAAEAPVLFSKACEMFILELTHRAWSLGERSKRRTLHKSDVSSAIAKFQAFDFLADIIPMEEEKEGTEAPSNESISCLGDPSELGPLMMDVRNPPQMVNRGLSYVQRR